MRAFAKVICTIVLAITLGMPSIAEADRSIDFGPPGPPQTIAFRDDVASASVTFRVAPDARYDAGPAAVSPSISSGAITVRAFGTSRRYDLATILPIATNRIVLSRESSCGTATALSRSGHYIVVEAVLAEKGCAPLAAFIDVRDGRVAKEAIFDPSWAHRFDVRPYHASGAPIRIVRVERIAPAAIRWNAGSSTSTMVAWPFLIVHATSARGDALAFAVDPDSQPAVDASAVAFHAGDAALLADGAVGDPYLLVRFFSGELYVRPQGAAEARFDALQSPTPGDVRARIKRNMWFTEASERAARGDFAGAVDAFATMVSFHGGGEQIDAGDAAMLANCRNLLKRVRAGAVSSRAAGDAFPHGCVVPAPSSRMY